MLVESIICEDNMLHYYRGYNRERYVLQQREKLQQREVCITTKRERERKRLGLCDINDIAIIVS